MSYIIFIEPSEQRTADRRERTLSLTTAKEIRWKNYSNLNNEESVEHGT